MEPESGEQPRGPLAGAEVDVEASAGQSRPVHLRWGSIGLVALGGATGTAVREALSTAFPAAPSSLPLAIFAINVVGAFALGLLIEALSRRGDDSGPRRRARLLLGTGVLGGFTTYSALATDTALLLGAGGTVTGLGYAAATLLLGGLATWLGIIIGTRLTPAAGAAR